jgi:hypothetical protein
MSEIRATTISDAAGTGPITLTKQQAIKAWANLLVSSGSPTVVGSFNNSSVTDVATGQYRPNWTNAFSAVNYGSSFSGEDFSMGGASIRTNLSTSYIDVRPLNTSFAQYDISSGTHICVAAKGDLA